MKEEACPFNSDLHVTRLIELLDDLYEKYERGKYDMAPSTELCVVTARIVLWLTSGRKTKFEVKNKEKPGKAKAITIREFVNKHPFISERSLQVYCRDVFSKSKKAVQNNSIWSLNEDSALSHFSKTAVFLNRMKNLKNQFGYTNKYFT